MFTCQSHDRLMQVVESQKVNCGILRSPYLLTLQNGGMSRGHFESTQQQFFFAVRFFSRAMAALAARVPDSRTRLPLIQNLSEEHGLAEADEFNASSAERQQGVAEHHSPFQPALAHDQTFIAFLTKLGVSNPAAIADQQRPAVRAFNLALWGACASEPPSAAFACLGAIEYAFADISAMIGNCVVDRGWIRREDLVHYKLHAEIDKRHAAEFFSVVQDDWAQDDAGRQCVESGLALGFYLFKRLYDDLLAEAADE